MRNRTWFALVILLACCRAEALGRRDICWDDVCAGMTLPQVEARLGKHGFKVHSGWLSRWIQRWRPRIGGVREYEGYIETMSAIRGAKCNPIPIRRRIPCASLDLAFVRFPSGRRRLLSLNGAESVPKGHLASELITNWQAELGPPDRAEWDRRPNAADGKMQWTFWDGHWEGKYPANWLTVRLNLLEKAAVKAGTLSPPDLETSVHAQSVDASFYARWVGREAERSWRGEHAGWTKDPRTGCRLWNSYPRRGDTVRWDGRCVKGYASGYGVARWSEFGREYEIVEGEFRGGKLNGHAEVTAGTAVRFDGEFRDNRPDGPGTLVEDGETYSGDWSKGCFAHDGKRTAFFTDLDHCNNF